MVEGVVAPESANNGAVIGSMVPLLALGIPFSATAAVLLAGLRMHNVEAGPMLFREAPNIFWGFVAAMYLGNLVLLILNLPLVGVFARIATIRSQMLMPVVGILCLVGTYSIRFSTFDIWVMLAAGVFGFFCRGWGLPVAPLVIGMVLGPMTENNLRLTMQSFEGQIFQIVYQPLAMIFLAAAVLFQLFMSSRSRIHLSIRKEDKK
jgi:putative tricarboxylic transport membrane protein